MARSLEHVSEQMEQTQRLDLAIRSRQLGRVKDAGLVVGASLLMAIAAHISVPLFGGVPVTMQPLAMLLIAFFFGANRASAAMVVYLLEGASGLPVFSPAGLGGIAQLMGLTGGFLMATPLAAYVAGFISRKKGISYLVIAAIVAEIVLFTFGASWFAFVSHATAQHALSAAVVPFLPGEALKIAIAVSAASLWNRRNA